jgi:hypothetical protein
MMVTIRRSAHHSLGQIVFAAARLVGGNRLALIADFCLDIERGNCIC